MYKPLRRKKHTFVNIDNYLEIHGFKIEDVKSAFEWMIQIHEEKIEEFIGELNVTSSLDDKKIDLIVCLIEEEYENIMVLEAGLEDVI